MGRVAKTIDVETAGPDPLARYYPTQGWIYKYLKWTENSEPPSRYRFAVALGLVSSMLNRNVYLPYENRGTFPNLWLLLMGPPGCGKDSAINQGYELFMKLDERPKVIAEKITPEALIKTLHGVRADKTGRMNRDCKGVVFAPELATFLGRSRYNEGMIQLLTRLYDCPSVLPTETIIRKNLTLFNVCVNMIWGSTPDWYTRYMPDGAMCGGFMSRVTYMFYFRREKRIPNPVKFNGTVENELAVGLEKLGRMEGAMQFEPAAEEFFNDWYINLPEPGDSGIEEVDGFTSRKPLTCKKISIILAAAETYKMYIKLHHVQNAVKMMDILEKHLYYEVPKMTGTASSIATDVVYRVVASRKEGFGRRELMQRTYRKLEGKRDEFDRIIDWLLQMGRIEQLRQGDKNEIWYRKIY